MDLNDDVLRRIFMEVLLQSRGLPHNPDLLSASLVCHRWTGPAQAALYHAVSLSIGFDRAKDERATRFCRTMRTCPHLLRLIRYLIIKIDSRAIPSPRPECLSWVGCIPQDALLSFELNPQSDLPSRSWQDVLIRAPAVHTVRYLTLGRCRHHADTLSSIAAFPQLEELSIVFADCLHVFDDTIIEPGMAAAFPKLRAAWFCSTLRRPSTSTINFLALVTRAPQLQTLEVQYFSPDSHSPDKLIAAFRSMTPTIKWFSVVVATWHPLIPPFMDEVVSRLTYLNTLAITGRIFSGALLQRLPRTLISLYLDASPGTLSPGPGSGETTMEYVTRAIRMRDPLKMVTLKHLRLSSDLRTRILNTCLKGGIKCELHDV